MEIYSDILVLEQHEITYVCRSYLLKNLNIVDQWRYLWQQCGTGGEINR